MWKLLYVAAAGKVFFTHAVDFYKTQIRCSTTFGGISLACTKSVIVVFTLDTAMNTAIWPERRKSKLRKHTSQYFRNLKISKRCSLSQHYCHHSDTYTGFWRAIVAPQMMHVGAGGVPGTHICL